MSKYEVAVELEVAGAPPPARWQLLRVVPGPPERVDGWRVTVACLYDAGIGVRWHAEAAYDTTGAVVPQGAAADDRGTAYTACRARIEPHLGEWLFTPAPPRGAAHLDVTFDGRTFRIPL